MLTLIGILLFVGLLVASVAIHEAGHLLTAKSFGMKATEYFVGFGPKLWSIRRGETEYGFKAIPAGGYVKIVGMTALEEVDEADRERAFYNYSAPKKLVVLSAGSISHMFVAFFMFAFVFMAFGGSTDGPGLREASTKLGVISECIPATGATACKPGDPPSPAKAAGLRSGDRVVAVGATPVNEWLDAVQAIRAAGTAPIQITFERAGQTQTVTVTPVPVEREDAEGNKVTVGVIGVQSEFNATHAGPLAATGDSVVMMGKVVKATGETLADLPQKVVDLFGAISGDERDQEGLVGVVGVARISGEVLSFEAATVSERLAAILVQVAALNVFIGLFNALPLLPLDGGHMAVVSYEHGRRRLYKAIGRADPGRVDMNKLLPLAYGFLLLVVGLTVLLLAADIVNPITLS